MSLPYHHPDPRVDVCIDALFILSCPGAHLLGLVNPDGVLYGRHRLRLARLGEFREIL